MGSERHVRDDVRAFPDGSLEEGEGGAHCTEGLTVVTER